MVPLPALMLAGVATIPVPAMALALSCARTPPDRAFQQVRESRDAYIVVAGQIDFNPEDLPAVTNPAVGPCPVIEAPGHPAWLVHYYTERPHPGYGNVERWSIETVMSSFGKQEDQEFRPVFSRR